MVKPEEIRISNWFHHKKGWSYRHDEGEFDFQWEYQDWYALGECTLSLDDIEPILLTEEWLVRFGFEKIAGGFFLSNGIIELYFHGGTCGINTEGQCLGLPNIQHVHQLQNLYFALTGEELNHKFKP